MLPTRPVAQIAYVVNDVRASALKMAKTFGAGPFFLLENIQLSACDHRGSECLFVHTSAYGQWGTVMMELVRQEDDGPSPFRDLYAPGQEGLHHTATIVDDFDEACADYAAHGFDLATRAVTTGGTEFGFVDATAVFGHFIEVYEGSSALLGFYAMVRDAAQGWTGEDPLRSLD